MFTRVLIHADEYPVNPSGIQMRRVEEMTVNTNGNAPQTTTALKALTDFFQTGDGKRPMTAWRDEIKVLKESLTPEEYEAFAAEAAAALGKTLVAK